MWLIFLLNLACGSTFTISKLLLFYAHPLTIVTIRMLIAGGLLFGYYYLKKPQSYRLTKQQLRLLGQYAFLGLYLSYVLEFWALQYMSSSKAAFMYNLIPFITALFAYYSFGEKMTGKKIIGLIIGFIGFLPLLLSYAPAEEGLWGNLWFLSFPELLLLIAVIASSYQWITMKKLLDSDANPITINSIAMILAGFMSGGTNLLFHTSLSISNVPMFLFWLIALIILGNIIFYNLYGYLLQKYSITFLTFTGYSIPFFTAFFSWILLGETLNLAFIVSALIVFIGLYIFYKEELRLGYIKI